MSTETVGLLGRGAQVGHLDFHTAPSAVREYSALNIRYYLFLLLLLTGLDLVAFAVDCVVVVVVDVDRFYIALFSALEQTHCVVSRNVI